MSEILRKSRLGCTAILIGAIALLTGCADAAEIPPEEKEAINLGVNAEIGSVSVDNLLLVSRGESEPARILGVLLNESEEAVDVTFSDDDDEVTVRLDAQQQYAFHENAAVFDTADGIPGSLVPVTVEVAGESELLQIPVQDDSRAWLAPYLPATVSP